MMGYDYNGWGFLDPLTGYNSPLFPESYDKHFFNTNNLVSFNFFIFKSVKKKKTKPPKMQFMINLLNHNLLTFLL